jgi:cleavage and polyadenylation specificity factor subunit 1
LARSLEINKVKRPRISVTETECNLSLREKMHALRHDILPPSGVEFATTLKLTPSTATGFSSQETGPRVLSNVVVARSNLLRIFEVWEQPRQISTLIEDERERRADVRRGTEAVEGEVEMDEGGEGWVNMGSVKVNFESGLREGSLVALQATARKDPSMVTRFHFVREHTLHGTVTGMESVRIMSTYEDQLDRLLVSFKDAKV